MTLHALIPASLLALSLPALACTPPPLADTAGFPRAQVAHLPANALGVVFLAGGVVPKPSDFAIASAQDKRPLGVRIRTLQNGPGIRLEPLHGFQPGAHYTFRYRSAHGHWVYPDVMTVRIGHDLVDTGGSYAFAPAPQPVQRVLTLPTSSGACVAPAPVVVQEFGYSIPGQLAAYRDVLAYDVGLVRPAAAPAERRSPPRGWPEEPDLYVAAWPPYSRMTDYTAAGNAVFGPCRMRPNSVRVEGSVSFPEVDDRRYRLQAMDVDFGRAPVGGCNELDALLQTMQAHGSLAVLRGRCRIDPGAELGGNLATLGRRGPNRLEWTFQNLDAMGTTCYMTALAQRWRGGRDEPAPRTLRLLGRALGSGYALDQPAGVREETSHSLFYLVNALPADRRGRIAPPLLKPVVPALVDALAAPQPSRPEELAQLIGWSGRLVRAERVRVQAIASGQGPGAAHARAILASQGREGLAD